MPIFFPDILENNNSNYPLVDATFLKGNAYPLAELADTGSIPTNKRRVGLIVFTSGSQEWYGYKGQDVSGWDTPSNWEQIGAGGGGSTDYISNVAYDTGSISFTGVGSAFDGVININALTSSLVSNSQTSSFVTNDETGSFYYSSSVNLNTVTFYQGDGTTESVTVDTGSAADISALNTFTGSIQIEVDNLTAATSSYITNSQTSSMAVGSAINTYITVKNKHTGTIAKGMPCYITGSETSGNVVGVVPADAGDPAYMPAGVVLAEELTNPGDEGIGYINGWINGVDTSAFQSGDNVYVAVGGGYTNIKPTGNNLIQKLGNVEKVHASNGSGVIVGAGRANDLPNINPGHFWVGDNDWVPQAVSTGSFLTGEDTGSFLYSGSYNSTTNAITLYSIDQDYNLDLSGLAGGEGGFAITASYTGSELTKNARSFDFEGNGVNATNVGNAVTVTITQVDTGSLYYSSSVNLNTVTFYQGDGTTESVTVDTGSSVDISALNLHTGSINTFTGSIQTEVDNLTAATSSYVTNDQTSSFVTNDETGSFYYSSSVELNTITFFQGDGTTESVTVDTGSAVAIDTGSFYISSSVSLNTITFTQGDGTTESVTVNTGSGATIDTGSFYVSSSLSNNIITFTQGDGTTENVRVTGSNIYNTDGTLTADRTVTAGAGVNGNSLTFEFQNANFIINSDPDRQVQINNLDTTDTPQIVGYADGVLKAMSTSSFKPGGPAKSFQFNKNNTFSGSSVYFDSANERVGIGETSPERPLHITDTDAVAIKLERTDAPEVGIQFFGNGASGGGAIIRGLNNDFEVIQRDTVTVANERNLFISESGEVHAPRLNNTTTPNIVGYDSATGELTYYSTGSFGSGGGSIDTGSFYISSSLSNNIITFTQGDGTTESVTVTGSNIYNTDGTLTADRTIGAGPGVKGKNLFFDFQNANFVINSDPTKQVQINNLDTTDTPQIVGYADGVLKAMSTSSFKPGGTDTQVQYNNGGSFGGSSIRFDDVNSTVGINVTPYSNRAFAVSSSAGIAMRLQSEQATANRIQFVNSSSVGFGVIAGAVNGDDFHLQQTDTTLQENLYISASGEVYAPRLKIKTTSNVVYYDDSTGEIVYNRNVLRNVAAPTGSVQYTTGGASATTSSFVSVAGTIRTNTGETSHASPVIPQLNGKTLGTDAFITATWADTSEASNQEQFCVLASISGSGQLVVETSTVSTGREDAIIFQGMVLV